MAKKTKAKNIKSSTCCPVDVGYTPNLYLDLEGKDTSQIEGITVGEEVQVLVTGKVTSISQRTRTEDGKERKTGSIQIENYEVAVVEDEKNEFVKMAVDDESGE